MDESPDEPVDLHPRLFSYSHRIGRRLRSLFSGHVLAANMHREAGPLKVPAIRLTVKDTKTTSIRSPPYSHSVFTHMARIRQVEAAGAVTADMVLGGQDAY